MKLATFNINGIKARIEALPAWLAAAAPDVVCLQEIKSVDEAFPRELFEGLGYRVETHGQKGFNGVAILSKLPLSDVRRGLPGDAGDEQARWIEALDRIEKPIIAALHGYCMGGGMELALACDIRFAAPEAIFALPETGLGLIPGGGGTQRLARVIGPGRAMDALLTGERYTAEQARDIGLVTRIASSAETLLQEVAEFATRIAVKPPLATLYVKRAARAALDLDLKKGLDLELDLFAMLAPTSDVKEAAQAFSEKREPRFSGR